MTTPSHTAHTQQPAPGWCTLRFGDVVRNVDEAVRDLLTCDLERFVGLEHIDPESLRIKRWGLIADGTSFTRKFTAGQVLFGKRRAYQRKVAVADFDGLCSSDILVFEPADDRLLPELLPFIVQTEGFFQHALGTSAGSLSPRTRWRDLAAYEFALPSLDEQRRIAEILWAAEDLQCELERLVESQEVLENSLMARMLSTGISLACGTSTKMDPVFGIIPEAWHVEPVSRVANVAYGISEAVASNNDPSIGWPILTGANITLKGNLDLFKVNYIAAPKKDEFILQKGDLLINWRSGSPEHVGKVAIFDLEGNYTFASFILRVRVMSDIMDNVFLHRLLNFMRHRHMFSSSTSQQVNFKMNASVFRDVPVVVPPIAEQQEIVSYLLAQENASTSVEKHLLANGRLKRELVGQLLSS